MEGVEESHLKGTKATVLALVVAVLVVIGTAVGSALLYFRRQREIKAKGRCHFVKAASLLSQAEKKGDNPREARALAEKAIGEADAAIAIDPKDAAYHLVKSLSLEVVGRSGAAIKELSSALSRPESLTIPERSVTLVKRAALLTQAGNFQEALHDLQESAALTPDSSRTQELLGETYEKDGNIDKAIEAFNQAVLLDPKSPGAKAALQRLQS